ncbi:MAG: nucleoside 2-deoxyribosyltransferase [Acidobacteria bacterium]|nr:nucleoside 2-deoxyribosyltransferase [Acidobacteriota bacterium]
MRIYLACTVRGDRGAVEAARRIGDRLRHHGHDLITAHLLEDDVDHSEARLTERVVYDRDIEWLAACDALVAEASGSSFGVGFEVGYVVARARHTGQRVYLLFDAERRHRVSRLILGNADPCCTTCAYRSLDDITAFIDRHFSPR